MRAGLGASLPGLDAELVVPVRTLKLNNYFDSNYQIQVHGGEGISQDQVLAQLWAGIRTLRFADGPGASPSDIYTTLLRVSS